MCAEWGPSVLRHCRADAMLCCAVLCVLGSLLLPHGADRFAADDLELKPEPTLESFGIKTNKGAAANQQQQSQQEEEGAAAAVAADNGAAPGSEDEPGGWRACYAAVAEQRMLHACELAELRCARAAT